MQNTFLSSLLIIKDHSLSKAADCFGSSASCSSIKQYQDCAVSQALYHFSIRCDAEEVLTVFFGAPQNTKDT